MAPDTFTSTSQTDVQAVKKSHYTFKATFLSVIYWLVDSGIHCLVYSEGEFEFIPSETNELWMRLLIVALLVCFGAYADHHTKLMLKKEKEKHVIFNATVSSTQHILNNLLNQMQFFKMKADEANAFDDTTNALYEQSVKEGAALVKKLCEVEELTEDTIKAAVHPDSHQ